MISKTFESMKKTLSASSAYDQEDIRRDALSMIANHGENAMAVAMKRANNLTAADSVAARRIWERIVSAIGEIEKQSVHTTAH